MQSPNDDIIRFWNDIAAPKFVRFRTAMTTSLAAHGRFALDRFPPAPGAAILDVGCGFGDAAIELAERVGPTGTVLGIDCGREFVEIARREFEAPPRIRFQVADAQTDAFAQRFDYVFSRFGTMFFSNPVSALRNLRGATHPGGRLAMVVWRTLEENPWAQGPKQIALRHLPPEAPPAASCGPGPFSMASTDLVTQLLTAAGWREIEAHPCDAPFQLGTLDEAVDLSIAIGPAGEIVREAGARANDKRAEVIADLRRHFASHVEGEKVVVASASFTFTAINPG
ncbi:MAG: class I SAM-dependent methyltransferase [Polyangia bacterium]